MLRHLIIVPTYNESENIVQLIRQILLLGEAFSVLVVDDGSPDGTAHLVEAEAVRYPDRVFLITRPKKMGLGTAYIAGFQWALTKQVEFVYEMDADFSHTTEDLKVMSERLEAGEADLVVGSRYVGGIRIMNWPFHRLLLSYGASLYTRWMTRLPILDSTSGFMGYRASVLRRLNLARISARGYFFQILMKYLVWKSGSIILEHPIVFYERRDGQTKMSSDIVWEALISVALLSIRYRYYLFDE